MDTIFYILSFLGAVVSVVYVVSDITRQRRLRQARDTIVNAPDPRVGRGPGPKPLTPEEKIDELYKLSKSQGQSQFISNLGWTIIGIVGGYLAGHFLPH